MPCDMSETIYLLNEIDKVVKEDSDKLPVKTSRPIKASPNTKPYKLRTFQDNSEFGNNGNSDFGFMVLLLFNILQFITIGVLIGIINK